MRAKGSIVEWTPAYAPQDTQHRGKAVVVTKEDAPHPRIHGFWTDNTPRKGQRGKMTVVDLEDTLQVFLNFHTLVVRDGISPDEAHRAFLVLDEYATRISPDIKGARKPAKRRTMIL